jgi:ABC-2 type transport system ATP-binding protein
VEEGDFFAMLGPERRRQDHADRHRHLAGQQDRRQGERVRPRPRHASSRRAKACIGVVPQEINLNLFETPETIVVNQAGFYGIPRQLARERAEKYLKQLQLWDRRARAWRARCPAA